MSQSIRPTQDNDGMKAPRRKRVPGPRNSNIYERPNGALEIGFKDGTGKQRWRTVPNRGGIQAARVLRDELLAQRGRGEKVAANPRLRFGVAADAWLDGPVKSLRPRTQESYAGAVRTHLRPRFEGWRLDQIEAEDIARLVREMRAAGSSEWTIKGVLVTIPLIYKHAARHLGWSGRTPTDLLTKHERPNIGQTAKRKLFDGEQIADVVRAAEDPWKTLFLIAALTGARLSEVSGLVWSDIDLSDRENPEIHFQFQVDRKGVRQLLKSDGSVRRCYISSELAAHIAAFKLKSTDTRPDAFVFATRSGRPVAQRNVSRALRAAQTKARTADGTPTYPVLHEKDEHGDPVEVPRGALPTMHSFRHTFASRALKAGESADEVAFLLGHKDATVTRVVYIQEIADARRQQVRRSRMATEYGSVMEAAGVANDRQGGAATGENVRAIRGAS